MGIKGWYLSGSEKAKSSYTEFNTTEYNRPESSYTDFTAVNAGGYERNYPDFMVFDEDEQFESAPVRKPAKTKAAGPAKVPKARAARPAKVKAKPAKAEKAKPAKAAKTKPIKKSSVRQPEVDFEAASEKPKKKSKGKAFLCAFGALTVVMAAVVGTGCYFGYIDIEDFLNTANIFGTDGKDADKESGKAADKNAGKEDAMGQLEQIPEKATKKMVKAIAVDMSHPAYECAERILDDIRCGNDVDTAYAIFDWVHSNILYQTIFEDQSYEDAAYMGFTRRSGDCYVYFSCAKMLLDCAGIPNMMVTRYPVVTNGHYWNLVQLNGEWYHCDATVFRDHYDMYFMCTDDEIDDGHHDFDHSLYPERASGYSGYQEDWWGVDPDSYNDPYTDDWSDDDWNDWSDDWSDDDWNGLTEEDYYNIDVQYDNSNEGYAGEIDDDIYVWEDDFEDDWN